MNKINILLFVPVIILSFTTCRTVKEKEAITDIDSQLVYINTIIEQFRPLPVDSLIVVYKEKLHVQAEELSEIDQVELEDDAASVAQFLDYVTILENKLLIAKDCLPKLLYAQRQFETLRTDISKGNIPADSIDIYLTSEKDHLYDLKGNVEEILELKTLPRQYYNSEKIVDSILLNN